MNSNTFQYYGIADMQLWESNSSEKQANVKSNLVMHFITSKKLLLWNFQFIKVSNWLKQQILFNKFCLALVKNDAGIVRGSDHSQFSLFLTHFKLTSNIY